jgi:hypothetical protein
MSSIHKVPFFLGISGVLMFQKEHGGLLEKIIAEVAMLGTI